MDESEAVPSRGNGRRITVAAGIAGGLVAIALLGGWIERRPIVVHFVDNTLRAAHVPAHYRIVAIGPFVQRLENVRIGNPSAPDLTARSLELVIGYSWHGPTLEAVHAEGVRLSARVADGRVLLGAIDRLLPAPSGAPLSLPNIDVTLKDARVVVDTPAGRVGARVEGSGNLTSGFAGRATLAAPLLTASGCVIRGATADVRIEIAEKHPHFTGPLDLTALSCPSKRLTLGKGRATLDTTFSPTLDHIQGGVALAGFAGNFGSLRFNSASGLVTLAGDVRRMEGTTGLSLTNAANSGATAQTVLLGGRYRYIPGAAGLIFAGDLATRHAALSAEHRDTLLGLARGLANTPVAPLITHLADGLNDLLADADANARIAFAAGGSAGTGFSVRSVGITGRHGGFVHVDEGDGFGWQARDRAWRIDGRVRTGGGKLPVLDVRLSQGVAGAPVEGVATLAPYATGGARLTMTPLTFVATGTLTRFATRVALDGPLGSGRVTGLTLPLAGQFGTNGTISFDAGCTPLHFASLTLGAIVLKPAQINLCGEGGQPLVGRSAEGALHYGAVVSNIRLEGRSARALLSVGAMRIELSARGVGLRQVELQLGDGDAATRFAAVSIDGVVGHDGLAGPFAGASAQIAHVPLAMTDLTGRWVFAKGALQLSGGATISDAQDPRRFEPLVSHDAALRFANGRIDATASLHEPKSDALVASVTVHHSLADDVGGATLDVPGLHFVPDGLQPEALTPLTLGVIANTNGTVAGKGRVDWTGRGVTSSGRFHTEGLDFAAAAGPISRITGTIDFTDLLGLVTPSRQTATIGEINPGVAVSNGTVHYQLIGNQQVRIEDALWPFAGGELILDPTTLSFDEHAQRHLTLRVHGLNAAAFVQQLSFPNISATGIFDGSLPMIFDQAGGRIVHGELVARKPGGTLAYVGELTNAQLGTMGKLAFDALKAIRYKSLAIVLDGRLDGEMISSVQFEGVRQETGDSSYVARLIYNLPFRFNINIRAPFRGLMGSARAFVDPSQLLDNVPPPAANSAAPAAIQPAESESMR